MNYLSVIFLIGFSYQTFAADYIIKFSAFAKQAQISKYISDNSIILSEFSPVTSRYFRNIYNAKTDTAQAKLLSSDIVLSVETIDAANLFSIDPKDSKSKTRDDLSNYQWHKSCKLQIVHKDITDIKLETFGCNRAVSMGWSEKFQKMESEVVVAVIDSGLALDHPELEGKIYKNEIECNEKGQNPYKAKLDKDNNGYKGDCMGWNFISDKSNPLGTNLAYDDLGHGTHVAGIIAAKTNNNYGISGLGDKIKILPLRVFTEKGDKNQAKGLTDRIAKAILYAVDRKVDVINMSMGWPKAMDKEYLREAIKLAQLNNITIVAAAGNNNNDANIYPCSYKGVICVGALRADAKVATFSNYGGSVDLMAYGDNILSLYPKKMNPSNFSIKGFEIKNGTSQAAPIVSSLVSQLKSKYKSITSDEILYKLYKGSSKNNINYLNKSSMFGLVNFKNTLSANFDTPLIVPSFKQLQDIVINPKGEFTLSLSVKNLGPATEDMSARVQLGDNIVLEKRSFYKTIQSSSTQVLKIKGSVLDTAKDNSAKLSVIIDDQVYSKELSISKRLSNQETKAFVFNKTEAKIAIEHKGRVIPLVRSVSDQFELSKTPFYYLIGEEKESITLSIFNAVRGEMIAKTHKIKNASKILAVQLGDFNVDGELDFAISSIINAEKPYIEYRYLDLDLNPLLNKYIWQYSPNYTVEPLSNKAFIARKVDAGLLRLPVFQDKGPRPVEDQNIDPWQGPELKSASRVYMLKAKDEQSLRASVFLTDSIKDEIRAKINLQWDESLQLVHLLPQSLKDYRSNAARAIFSWGNRFNKNYAQVTIKNDSYELNPIASNNQRLESTSLLRVRSLADEYDKSFESLFTLSYGPTKMNLIQNTQYEISSSLVSATRPTDYILGAIASYQKFDTSYTFYQSKSSMHLKVVSGDNVSYSSKPILRYSFIPGEVFNQMFYPITVGRSDKRAALYIDGTQISSNHISIHTINEQNELITPIESSIFIDKGCSAMNPVPFGENKVFHIVLLCKVDNVFKLLFKRLEK